MVGVTAISQQHHLHIKYRNNGAAQHGARIAKQHGALSGCALAPLSRMAYERLRASRVYRI